jgi:tetratricopeptide (TPR) repeat protein/predicted AlkP superfamily phosphohydrolase/phosphomutase
MLARGRPARATLALCAVLAASLASASCSSSARQPRVFLLGVDGVDPEIVERIMESGRLPTFARLRSEGAFGPLRSREPLLSPIVWTTIVTGRKAQDHGILDFVELSPDGRAVPITSARRTAPALWNVAGQFGRRSGFVGWYGSYPAEEVRGFQVSDRVAFHQVKSERASRHATFPEGLADELRQRFGDPRPDLEATRRRFLDEPSVSLSGDGSRRLGELAKVHATAEYYRRILPFLQERYRPDLLAGYFELVDACGHLFMEDAPPRRPGVTDEDFRAFAGTVDRCYEYQDEVLADLLKLEGRTTVTIVCSDHGFKSGEGRPRTSGRADVGLAPLWHRRQGVVFVHGRGAAAGKRLENAGILDIAPTVLALLDVPLSRELAGAPLWAAFAGGGPRERPGIAAYAPNKAPSPPIGNASDPAGTERLEALRALGYLGPAGPIAHDATGRTAASFLNEGSARASDGDLEGALRAYARVLELDPGNVNARVYAARIHSQKGDLARAGTLLDEALGLDPRSLNVRLQRASWAVASRHWKTAAEEIEAARGLDDRLPNVHLLEARLADARGRSQEVLEALHRAESLADAEGLLGEILLFEADVAGRLGHVEAAERALHRAETLAAPAEVAIARADVALQRGDAKDAVSVLRAAAAASPEDSGLARKLGQTLAAADAPAEAEAAFRQAIRSAKDATDAEGGFGDLSLLFQKLGRETDARDTLRTAVDRLPESSALWGMLGAALGRSGDLGGAISAYERSVAIRPTPLACKTLAALLFEERKDRDRAVALWKQSLDLEPGQADVEDFLKRYGSRSH